MASDFLIEFSLFTLPSEWQLLLPSTTKMDEVNGNGIKKKTGVH